MQDTMKQLTNVRSAYLLHMVVQKYLKDHFQFPPKLEPLLVPVRKEQQLLPLYLKLEQLYQLLSQFPLLQFQEMLNLAPFVFPDKSRIILQVFINSCFFSDSPTYKTYHHTHPGSNHQNLCYIPYHLLPFRYIPQTPLR